MLDAGTEAAGGDAVICMPAARGDAICETMGEGDLGEMTFCTKGAEVIGIGGGAGGSRALKLCTIEASHAPEVVIILDE